MQTALRARGLPGTRFHTCIYIYIYIYVCISLSRSLSLCVSSFLSTWSGRLHILSLCVSVCASLERHLNRQSFMIPYLPVCLPASPHIMHISHYRYPIICQRLSCMRQKVCVIRHRSVVDTVHSACRTCAGKMYVCTTYIVCRLSVCLAACLYAHTCTHQSTRLIRKVAA